MFDRGGTGNGLVDHRLEVEDLSPVKSDVGGNDQFGFGILDAVCEGRGAESGIYDTMNDADACAGEHGDDLFGNFRKVDRDPVALREPKLLERIRATIDLSVEFAIGDDPFLVVFTDPDDGHFVLAPGVHMTVQTVIGNVAGGADEPFGPGIVPFQNLGPGREPLKFLGDIAPETFRIGNRFLVGAFIVLNIGNGFGLSGRLIHTAFLEEGIDVFCHGAMTPSGRQWEANRASLCWRGGEELNHTLVREKEHAGPRCGCRLLSGLGLPFLDSRAEAESRVNLLRAIH